MYHVEQEGRIRDEIDRGTAVFFLFSFAVCIRSGKREGDGV